MGKISFNVDAYTARLIGRENVSKLNGAIIELIKNTYDADADICVLYYEKTTDTLYIMDNGHGMNEDIIINHWMTIGRSTKKTSFKTPSGRIQTGAKGIGRFALDRISDRCEMLTITRDTSLLWKVDWNEFSLNKNITDVKADLDETRITPEEFLWDMMNPKAQKLILSEVNKKKTGTIFKLTNLRDEWSEKSIEKIKEDIITLIPYELRDYFRLYFFVEASSFEEAKLVNDEDKSTYDYKIEFKVSESGKTRVSIWRNEFDFKDQFDEIMDEADFSTKDEAYFKGKPIIVDASFSDILPNKNDVLSNTIGEFSGILYFQKGITSKDDLKRYFYRFTETSKGKDFFSGIKIYRDSFRVRPYGEHNTTAYDWLMLSNRKTKSPAAPSHEKGNWRVGADQITGSIFISRLNLTLPDQSNREGIVETREFILLRQFIANIINLFEKDRQYVFRKLRVRYEEKEKIAQYEKEIIEKAAKNDADNIESSNSSSKTEDKIYPEGKDNDDKKSETSHENQYIEVTKAKAVLDRKDEIIQELKDDNGLLRTLATTGIITNTYIHEMKGIAHKLKLEIINAKEAIEMDKDIAKALEHIRRANEIRESLNSWFKVTIDSVKKDKRKRKKNNLNYIIILNLNSWKAILEDVEIRSIFQYEEMYLRCYQYDIDSIFSNLIANSKASFIANPVEDQQIQVNVSEDAEAIIFDYYDSGMGLSSAYKKNPERILESMESDKRDRDGEGIGTGMGMWIIHNIVKEYDGEIDLSKNKELTDGFRIRLKLMKNKRDIQRREA